MALKKNALTIALVLFSFGFAINLHAETFFFSAGIPVARSFSESDEKTDSISGLLLHANIPLFPGVGYESYESTFKGDALDSKLKTEMYDIFYLLPIPIVNITIGAGIGTSKLECDTCSDLYKNEGMNTNQLYAQFGFPIFPLFDLHLSYHSISGKVEGKNSTSDVKIAGTMYAIGVAFVF